jgi:hypothetical protein
MKKLITLLVAVLAGFSSIAQNYYQPYPITAQLLTSGPTRSILCTVYDSVLLSNQTYQTPFYDAEFVLVNNNNGIVGFHDVTNAFKDTLFGAITYDHITHQFMPIILSNVDFNGYAPGATLFSCGQTAVRYSLVFMGEESDSESEHFLKYDIIQHQWINYMAEYYFDSFGNCLENLNYTGAFLDANCMDSEGNVGIFDPITHQWLSTQNGCWAGGYSFLKDDYYFQTNDGFCNESIRANAFDAEQHSWKLYAGIPISNGSINRGVFLGNDEFYTLQLAGIYDEFLHKWVVDSIPVSGPTSYKIKDHVYAYHIIGSNTNNLHFGVYNFDIHDWVVDSVSAPGISTYNIQNGTINWTDNNGAHIRGFNKTTGWGNYNTQLYMDFHLVNFYNITGDKVIYVRNYSIGTDSVEFDFGDGVKSLDNTHVLWHFYKGNGPYTVTLNDKNANIVSSTQIVNFGCAAQASIGLASGGNICSGNSANLILTFAGTAPFTYSINGGASVSTSNNPETVVVTPLTTTTYNITSFNDANCNGTISGSATVTVSPVAPDFIISYQPGPVSGCAGNTANLTLNPVNNAQTYTWSAPAGTLINGQVSPVTTTSNSVTLTLGAVPANGSGWNICVFASNPCGNSQTKCAFIRGALSTPAAITGDRTVCPNTSGTYSTAAVSGANSYLWTGTNGITFTGSGTTVTANFPAGFTTGTICVAAQLTCGYTGPSRCITVTNNVGTLGAMTGAFAVCPGQTGLVYNVPPVAGAATYTWTVPTGVTITSGAGTNSITVNVGGNFSIGNICVTATSICGVVSAPRCKTLSSVLPSTPGNISGSATGVCNTTVTYSVPAVAGVTSYNWTLPSGATFATANGTNTINVTFSNSFTTGQLCVNAVNGCGASSARCINVKGIPATPGLISAPPVICANQIGTVFSVNPVYGAANYTWAIPSNATLVSGQGTNSIVVDWGANGGLVTVTASNGCGNSGTRTYLVTLTCRSASTELPGVIVAAYPNPVSSTLTVSMDTPSEGNFSMMMTDLIGRVMFEQQFKAVSGQNETAVDVSTLAKGIYMLTVKNENGFAKQIRVTVQ